MASTIRTMALECLGLKVFVALRGASQKQDVTLGRALKTEATRGKGKAAQTVVSYGRISRIDVPSPAADDEVLIRDPIQRDAKGGVTQAQYDSAEVKGIWEGDDFHEIDADQIKAIVELTKVDPLVIQEFVPIADVPWERAQASYFLAPPKGVGSRTLAVIRDAMETKGVAGVGKLMPKDRQKLAIVYPKHGGLMVTVLAYADTFAQVTDGAATIAVAEVNAEAVELMGQVIDELTQPVEALDAYTDDLIVLRSELIERAKMGEAITPPEAPDEQPTLPTSPDRLVESLHASIALVKKQKGKGKTRAKSGKAPAPERSPAKV